MSQINTLERPASDRQHAVAAVYGIRTTLDAPYDVAIVRATAALKEEGFGVLTTIDVKANFADKLGVDFRRYVILGACNPPLAYRAFKNELEIGLLMPCNVIVYETDDGRSAVAIADPLAMLSVTGNASLRDVALDAQARLARVIEKLQ